MLLWHTMPSRRWRPLIESPYAPAVTAAPVEREQKAEKDLACDEHHQQRLKGEITS